MNDNTGEDYHKKINDAESSVEVEPAPERVEDIFDKVLEYFEPKGPTSEGKYDRCKIIK